MGKLNKHSIAIDGQLALYHFKINIEDEQVYSELEEISKVLHEKIEKSIQVHLEEKKKLFVEAEGCHIELGKIKTHQGSLVITFGIFGTVVVGLTKYKSIRENILLILTDIEKIVSSFVSEKENMKMDYGHWTLGLSFQQADNSFLCYKQLKKYKKINSILIFFLIISLTFIFLKVILEIFPEKKSTVEVKLIETPAIEEKVWRVQLAACQTIEAAKDYVSNAQKEGLQENSINITQQGKWFRISVGEFASEKDANIYLKQLIQMNEKFKDSFVDKF